MSETIQFKEAMLDEQVYLVPDVANLTISLKNANQIPVTTENKHRLVVAASGNADGALSESARALIEKMISAVQLDPAVVPVLVYSPSHSFPFHQIRTQLQPDCLLVLGPDGPALRYFGEYMLYDIVRHNAVDIIFCDAAESMDKLHKAALWNSLKKVFNL